MKRYESRKISKSRKMIEALNPCTIYSKAKGYNPFSYLFASLQAKVLKETQTEEERQIQHQVKMAGEQRSAKSRQNRKRNKV